MQVPIIEGDSETVISASQITILVDLSNPHVPALKDADTMDISKSQVTFHIGLGLDDCGIHVHDIAFPDLPNQKNNAQIDLPLDTPVEVSVTPPVTSLNNTPTPSSASPLSPEIPLAESTQEDSIRCATEPNSHPTYPCDQAPKLSGNTTKDTYSVELSSAITHSDGTLLLSQEPVSSNHENQTEKVDQDLPSGPDNDTRPLDLAPDLNSPTDKTLTKPLTTGTAAIIHDLHNTDNSVTDQQNTSLSDAFRNLVPPALHVLTPGHERKIVRSWPRAPTGKSISTFNRVPGITAPNGIKAWGASISDFYSVKLVLGESHTTLMSGSMLAAWVRQFKEEEEAEFAVEELKRAKEEAEEHRPKRLEVDFTKDILIAQEERIRKKYSQAKGSDHAVRKAEETEDAGSILNLDPSGCPSPCSAPFSYQPERLQKSIPMNHLPKKLIVHDPWNLLAADARNCHGRAIFWPDDRNWTAKEDITHVYWLQPSERARYYREKHHKEVVKDQKSVAQPCQEEATSETEDQHGFILHLSDTFPVFIVHDPQPKLKSKEEGIDEAHLYLSPARPCGNGNHSYVWNAEWELPRSYFIPPPEEKYVMCRTCVLEDVRKILDEEKKTRDNKAIPPGEIVEGINELEPNGPIRTIRTTVAWQSLSHPTCQHIIPSVSPQSHSIPSTVRVSVAAKLSKITDLHLMREARNYQCFPQHLFEHWSGMNLLDYMDDPVPLGPVVPQFYGYYIPFDPNSDNAPETTQQGRYLSPILLVENCGEVIDYDSLTTDENNEVVSLFLRFHHAGWVHQSPFKRNVVWQAGPLNSIPSTRIDTTRLEHVKSFRLIDFGRSYNIIGAPISSSLNRYNTRGDEIVEIMEEYGVDLFGPRL